MYIDEQENIFDGEVNLGKIDGFKFVPSEDFYSNELIDSFITQNLVYKVDDLINKGDSALLIDTHFNVLYKNAMIAQLIPTSDILKPDFNPIIDERIQAIPLARLALHLESWLKRQINPLSDILDIIKKTENLSENSADFIKIIVDELGYCPRYKINNALKKLSPDDRSKLRKNSIRFAQYSIFARDIFKPAIQKIKLILWALKNNFSHFEMPASGVVTINVNHDLPVGYYDIAGYKICGEFAVRGDMIEKLADSVRSLAIKTDDNPNGEFEATVQHMSFVGKSGDAFDTILKSLGYDYRLAKVMITSAKTVKSENISSQETEPQKTDDIQAISEATEESVNTNMIPEESEPVTENNTEHNNQIKLEKTEESVEITEQEIEKKIWFWSPTPIKKNFKKSKNLYPEKNSTSQEGKFKDKPKEKQSKDTRSKEEQFKDKSFKDKQSKDKQSEEKSLKDNQSKEKQFKNQKTFNKKADTLHNEHSSSFVNKTKYSGVAPKMHKIAIENNPFAALQKLKDKNL